MKILAIIPAKGYSERLKDKNIREVNGKPMLYWAIKACQDSRYDIETWVSSDNDHILELAESFGAKPYKREQRLCEGYVFKQEVIRDFCSKTLRMREYKDKPDIVISLQPNSPQIKGSHLDNGIDTLIKHDKNEIFSVDKDLMQNGAFRIMKRDYVWQRDLSTYCGAVMCDIVDIHDKEDLEAVEETSKYPLI